MDLNTLFIVSVTSAMLQKFMLLLWPPEVAETEEFPLQAMSHSHGTWYVARCESFSNYLNTPLKAIRFLQEERPELIDRLPPVPLLPPAPRTICRVDNSYAKRHFKVDFIPWQRSLLDSVDSMLELELMATKIAKLRMVSVAPVSEVHKDNCVSVKA